MGNENIGQVQQGLVGGDLVDIVTQEEFGLVTLGSPTGSCSGSLLRNGWVIAAAHCVEIRDANGAFVPDPARLGQNVVVAPGQVQVTANWSALPGGGAQTVTVTRIVTFRPYDVCLLELAAPIAVSRRTDRYGRRLFREREDPKQPWDVRLPIKAYGRGIFSFAAGAFPNGMKSQRDGQWRVGSERTTSHDETLVWYPTSSGTMIAGGDSGGPSFVFSQGEYRLLGVHALCTTTCLVGYPCGDWTGPGPVPPGYNPWDWVSATPAAADARLSPIADQIEAIVGPLPADVPVPQYVGTFAVTPPNSQPMWLYGVDAQGNLQWYRKQGGDAGGWQGPRQVGTGWGSLRQIVPAGGNHLYAIEDDGTMKWFQHNGFNDGQFDWEGPVVVGSGWNFPTVFGAGDGIVYAIDDDGNLLWYRHLDHRDGGNTWQGPRQIGVGWGNFRRVFAGAGGLLYAVRPSGELLRYQHTGYLTGDDDWSLPTPAHLVQTETQGRVIGWGWTMFRDILPVKNNLLIGIQPTGEMSRYVDLGPHVVDGGGIAIRHVEERWEGPTPIGTGWDAYRTVVALIPDDEVLGPH